jgi:hypothetical protein
MALKTKKKKIPKNKKKIPKNKKKKLSLIKI